MPQWLSKLPYSTLVHTRSYWRLCYIRSCIGTPPALDPLPPIPRPWLTPSYARFALCTLQMPTRSKRIPHTPTMHATFPTQSSTPTAPLPGHHTLTLLHLACRAMPCVLAVLACVVPQPTYPIHTPRTLVAHFDAQPLQSPLLSLVTFCFS